MKIKILGLTLSSLLALTNAKSYYFNVVSILGSGSLMGVKYGTTVQPLTSSVFPLFTGTVEADNITTYKYVSLDQSGNVIEEESIERTYNDENSKLNEVYNRANKKVEVPHLPQPFQSMFPMGSKDFEPLPDNVIYNVYAKCDEEAYKQLSNFPFVDNVRNDDKVNCTINIISPNGAFQSTGSIHIIGYGSRKYKKVSWGMKFFENKFYGRKAVKLRALANDPTLIRERLSTELFKAAGVPVQEGSYARLFINDDIYGLYSFVDTINKRWMGAYIHGDPKAKIGVSYKLFSTPPTGPYSDFKYLGEDYKLYSDFNTYLLEEYDKSEYNENDMPALHRRLIDFTKFFDDWVKTYGNDSSDKAVEELAKFLNIEALLRLLVIESLILAVDNFFLVMSNSLIYYNPERNNYLILPFDFDQTLDGYKTSNKEIKEKYINDCITWVNYEDNEKFDHYFTNNILKNEKIKNRYNVILKKASTETFNPNNVNAYVHALADLIRDDVEWNNQCINNLGTEYDGYVNHFTLQHFESNLDYGHVDYDSEIGVNDSEYGIREWTEVRSAACIASTANVDTSNNDNISDKVEVKVYKPSDISSPSSSSSSYDAYKCHI
ncbi:hypothetical protein PIROE2DRAFT_3203 [Piromyces sp. E2]|nr:hypothetical protein PIROE2DRAFT_3203 [Piromyces sp. E2]|eukprot:OUM68974.1 hypothetical protein PIROE2DRAFT_3203 [Piromyces sp. E2]